MHPMTVAACVVLALLGCLGTVTASTTNTTTTIVSPSTSSAGIPLRLCFIPTAYIPADSIFVRHGGFAAKYFGQRYPEFDVEFTFATLDGGTTLTSIARGLMQESVQRCHALLGPLASSTCLGISPVINMPWLSHTASAVELANKDFHPWFSSVMPTDSFTGGALAAAVISRGWRTVSAVVIDTAYSKSYYAGFVEGMQHYGDGGNIERTVVVLVDATADEMRVQLRQLQTINTRIITFLAGLDGALERLVDVVLELGLDRTHVLVFGDGPCATGWARLSQLHGVLCTSYLNNASTEVPYIDAWLAHNTSDFDYFADFGVPPPPADYIWGGVLNSVLPDAVHALLETFHRQKARGGSLYDRQAINDLLRTVRIPGGISGSIELNANGERVGAAMGFYNVQPGNNSAGYRLHEYGQLSADGVAVRTDFGDLYWRISNASSSLPDVVAPPAPAEFTLSATLLVVVLAAVVLLLFSAAFVFKAGLSEHGLLVKLLRAGLLSCAATAVMNFISIVVSLIALEQLVADDDFGVGFLVAFGLVIGAGSIVSAAEFLLCAAYVWQWMGGGGGMALDKVTGWQLRLASTSVVVAVVGNLPVVSLTSAALALRSDSPVLVVVLTLITNGIMLGVRFADARFIISRLFARSRTDKVHRAIREELGPDATLTRHSDEASVAVVQSIIRTTWKKRELMLEHTARRIVVSLWYNNVERDEFFAVVWSIMGDLFSLLDQENAQRRLRQGSSIGSPTRSMAAGEGSIDHLVNFAMEQSSGVFTKPVTLEDGRVPSGMLFATGNPPQSFLRVASRASGASSPPGPAGIPSPTQEDGGDDDVIVTSRPVDVVDVVGVAIAPGTRPQRTPSATSLASMDDARSPPSLGLHRLPRAAETP